MTSEQPTLRAETASDHKTVVVHVFKKRRHKRKRKKRDDDDDDEEDDDDFEFNTCSLHASVPNNAISMMKDGDLLEDVSASGYRTSGIYHVSVDKKTGRRRVVNLSTDMDDYGTPAFSFPAFSTTHFYFRGAPLLVHIDGDTDDGAHALTSHNPYWHSAEEDDGVPMQLDTSLVPGVTAPGQGEHDRILDGHLVVVRRVETEHHGVTRGDNDDDPWKEEWHTARRSVAVCVKGTEWDDFDVPADAIVEMKAIPEAVASHLEGANVNVKDGWVATLPM